MMAVLSILPCTPSSSTARPEAPCFDTPEFSGIFFTKDDAGKGFLLSMPALATSRSDVQSLDYGQENKKPEQLR